MLLSGCASATLPSVITVTKSDCNIVPRIDLTLDEIDIIILDGRLHDLMMRIDKQEQIIDICNSSDHLD
jgi:hypothetical protein